MTKDNSPEPKGTKRRNTMRFQVQIWTRVGYPMLGIPCGSTGPGLSMPEIKKLGINRVNRIEHPRMYFAGYHQCGPKCESLHVACRFSEYNSGLFLDLPTYGHIVGLSIGKIHLSESIESTGSGFLTNRFDCSKVFLLLLHRKYDLDGRKTPPNPSACCHVPVSIVSPAQFRPFHSLQG